MQLPTATVNPCDDGASISTCEWQHVFPAWSQVSVNQAWLLNAAETGELTPADEWVWEELRLSKPTTARQQAEIYPTINLLLSISAPCCEWSLSTNVTGGKRTECGHVSPPSLLLCRLLKVSSVSRQTSSGVAVIYVSAPSVFPDLSLDSVLWCGSTALGLVTFSDVMSAVNSWGCLLLTFTL